MPLFGDDRLNALGKFTLTAASLIRCGSPESPIAGQPCLSQHASEAVIGPSSCTSWHQSESVENFCGFPGRLAFVDDEPDSKSNHLRFLFVEHQFLVTLRRFEAITIRRGTAPPEAPFDGGHFPAHCALSNLITFEVCKRTKNVPL
jgi:hypothetical protein